MSLHSRPSHDVVLRSAVGIPPRSECFPRGCLGSDVLGRLDGGTKYRGRVRGCFVKEAGRQLS